MRTAHHSSSQGHHRKPAGPLEEVKLSAAKSLAAFHLECLLHRLHALTMATVYLSSPCLGYEHLEKVPTLFRLQVQVQNAFGINASVKNK